MTLILLLTTSRYKSSSTIKIIDREAFVTAEMIRNAYQGIGSEYETLLGVLDKDNATFQKHAGTDRVKGAYMERVRAKNHVPTFIKANYKCSNLSMLEFTPYFIKESAVLPPNYWKQKIPMKSNDTLMKSIS